MQRTLRRYQIAYHPPPQHPRKSVDALRLLYAVDEDDRKVLSKKLFEAYWVQGRDVSDQAELFKIVEESGISSAKQLSKASIDDANVRKELEKATQDAIDRGAFGVPGFWIPQEKWINASGDECIGRFYWGQDHMHFVEASLLALRNGGRWENVTGLNTMMPRCIPSRKLNEKVKLEFWFDFSSPWAFLGWTQLERLKRSFGSNLEIVLKPFLLGILFREYVLPYPM